MGSALLNVAELEFAGSSGVVAAPNEESTRQEIGLPSSPAAGDLRAQVADRLAAHRRRRGGEKMLTAAPERSVAAGRSAQIAAAVAERYARTPSYREMLAAEAERAIQQARAAAEVAAQNAQAIAAAQQRLLEAYDEHVRVEEAEGSKAPAVGERFDVADGIGAQVLAASVPAFAVPVEAEQKLWPELAEQGGGGAGRAGAAKTMRSREVSRTRGETDGGTRADKAAGLTVRLYEDAAHARLVSGRVTARPGGDSNRGFSADLYEAEARALDEEIAFRQAPVFEEPAGPPLALPANLIEFPRQLVAARKARPRYAEGPLRDEVDAAPGDGQLRIFEVDTAQISTSVAEPEEQTAQWTSLWLDAPARAVAVAEDETQDVPIASAAVVLHPASLRRRCAAGAINAAIVGCGVAAFAGVFLAIAGHGVRAGFAELAQAGLQARGVATIGAVSCAFLMAAYYALFFWFSTATPGMRSVRIAFCTFDDENPTRRGVRRRMVAATLSACSLGVGFAWAAVDEQRLTWHDRMSRMYLRRY